MNSAGQVGDQDLDRGSLESVNGRTRISAADGLKPLPANATSAQIRAAYNQLLKKLKGS